ncbi:hypothetical protein CXF83_15005 [Shewanella sp. Choline-02u-19]|uniref:holin n=1 Tax=unclassified Shewanella TaxID=196818 RepID=UPI000C338708|nr:MULTISPECIES: holin [unclassified Shewanella]PKH62586.1 hypothetical protein CXF84_00925 [Shewanella sp. Bg11-22]PKI29361.1 hypothetical protein CXF83_15005 [Shewanella sp. Choline-02u-19]
MINDPNTQKVISTAAYSASFTTAAGGAVSVNQLALWIGILFAVLTFVVNWVYQAARNKRDAKLHELKAELIQAKLDKLEEA